MMSRSYYPAQQGSIDSYYLFWRLEVLHDEHARRFHERRRRRRDPGRREAILRRLEPARHEGVGGTVRRRRPMGQYRRDALAGARRVVVGHAAFHRTFFRSTDIEIADATITEIAPGVATAILLLKVGPFTPPDGVARPASENRLSLVLAMRSGRWLITQGHNTVIDPGAQRFDPVRTGWPDGQPKPG